jgi:NDP-sugar pyrophosphorylase family protein
MSEKKLSLNAMILAAGLGTRLRPLTNMMPKPLIPVCNHTMLDIVMSNLHNSGIRDFAVNTHYLPEMINAHIQNSKFKDFTHIYHEPEILGTGGPLINAKAFLAKNDFFIVHNSDILTDINLQKMVNHHFASGRKLTMALVSGPENKVNITDDWQVHDILESLGKNPAGSYKMTYSGIMIMPRDIFKYLPDSPVNCSIIKALLDMLAAEPGSVGAYLEPNVYWNDLGTLEQYFNAHRDILIERKLHLPMLADLISKSIADNAIIGSNVDITGFAAVGAGAIIGDRTSLCNCIVMNGTTIGTDELHCNQIISPNLTIHRNHSELKKLKILEGGKFDNGQISSLQEQGSSRGFYRVNTAAKSWILMLSDGLDQDFERFIYIGKFLSKFNFPTPEIYEYASEEFSVLIEDLGNNTIFKHLQSLKKYEDTNRLYRNIIDALLDFQLRGTALFKRSDAPILRTFDKTYLRWETGYFSRQFICAYCGIDTTECDRLNNEFDALAEYVNSNPRLFMHRDFQSQNIMLHNNRIRFVDFQGARSGPIGYDIMSLINDPYINFDVAQRSGLRNYFISRLKEMTNEYANENLEDYLIAAGLQRNMQALGAYAFLSLTAGKKQFIKFIPRGLELLSEGLINLQNSEIPLKLPEVTKIVNRLKVHIESKKI